MRLNRKLVEKAEESMASVLPITAIVFLLSISIAPLDPGTLVLFLFGAFLLIFGMGLFTLGVDMSMIPMGEGVGSTISKNKILLVPVVVYFLLGVLTTMAEPDLQVLSKQVPAIDSTVLILTVAVGVGLFLVSATLRIRWGWRWCGCSPGWTSSGCSSRAMPSLWGLPSWSPTSSPASPSTPAVLPAVQ